MSSGPRNKEADPLPPGLEGLSLAERLVLRHHFLDTLRAFFAGDGYLEVETPAMGVSPGIDPYIDAFKVDNGLYLTTSPELHMKRLLTAGLGKIFQVAKAFRAGEEGCHHNPEFTMLEWYSPGGDYHQLMDETESLVVRTGESLMKRGTAVPLERWPKPFRRISMDDVFRRTAGWVPSEDFDEERFFRDLTGKVEAALKEMGAVFVFDFPEPLGSLARRRPDNPLLAERFELYLDGLEICNGFTELTDPREQEEIFRRYNDKRLRMGKEPYPVDRRFLEALDQGLPPCAGNALGVDRLFMALTGAEDISQVMAFPGNRL